MHTLIMTAKLFPLQGEWKTSKRPPHDWPQKGAVEFKDYSTRYREGLELVLRGVTCFVNPTEKVCWPCIYEKLE